MEKRREPLTPTLNRVRRIMTLPAGAVLCREGDPRGDAYLVVSGNLRVFRRDRKNPRQNEELAELGPGAVVGELSAVLNQPRTATVQATTRVQVLAIPVDQLREMAQTHSSLLRVLIFALHERAGLTPVEIRDLASTFGVQLADIRQALEGGGSDQGNLESQDAFPAPPHDAAFLDTRHAICPACGTNFTALVFRAHMTRPTQSESDFHQCFSTAANPYDYEVWVCPNDLYASLQSDFADLDEAYVGGVAATANDLVRTRWAGERPDFTAQRDLALRQRSLELALEIYRLRGAPPARLASVLHRLAWCARERGDGEAEQRWLREAMTAYEQGYALGSQDDTKEDLRLQYLCGELARRLNEKTAAIRWFQQLLTHPEVRAFPMWERLARQQWSQLREPG